MSLKIALSLTFISLLAACSTANSGGAGNVPAAKTRPAPPRAAVRLPVHRVPAATQMAVLPGLEGIIGATSAELTREFGVARLDVIEGDARKLQYTNAACVLDIYLYPSAAGRERQATYLEARRASDAKEVDRAACVRALRRR